MDEKTKLVLLFSIAFFLTVAFYFPARYAYEFVVGFSDNVVGMMMFPNSITLIIVILVICGWLTGVYWLYSQAFKHLKKLGAPKREMEQIKDKIKEIDFTREEAEKQFFQRKINEDAYRKIQQESEQELVRLKAKQRKIQDKNK